MQNAIGLIGQAASAVAQNLAQTAKHAAESKHAASLAAAKAHTAQLKAAKAKAAAAAAQEEGEGAENLVTGAAVSLNLPKQKLSTVVVSTVAENPCIKSVLNTIALPHMAESRSLGGYPTRIRLCRGEMRRTQNFTPTTGRPGLLMVGPTLTPLSRQLLLLESVPLNQSTSIICR